NDALKLYGQIIGLANLTSISLATKNQDRSLKDAENFATYAYLKTLVSQTIRDKETSTDYASAQIFNMSITIGDDTLSEEVKISEGLIKQMQTRNILKNPANSPQKLLALQLNLFKTIYGYESIEIQLNPKGCDLNKKIISLTL